MQVRLFCATLLSSALLLSGLTPVSPQAVSTPPQTGAPPSATSSPKPTPATLCLARLANLIPFDADGLGMARSYVLTLAPFSSSPGVASGTIALYDAANRWDIPFPRAVVAADDQTPEPTPIVVRFPQAVRLDGGRLTSLDGPNGGPCRPYSIATTPPAQLANKFVAGIVAKAPSAHAIEAPQPVPDPAPQCGIPDVPSRVVKPTQPSLSNYPDVLPASGVVQILVWLDDTGNVLAGNVFRSSGSEVLDDSTFHAAISSTYSARIHSCRPIGDTNVFKAEFKGG